MTTFASPRLLCVFGLQRSGNHAIINWLGSLFPRTVHYNDVPHDFFTRPERVAELQQRYASRHLIVSFEDAVVWFTRGTRLLQSVQPPASTDFPDYDIRNVYILRDPYNCWASRVATNESGRRTLTGLPGLEDFIQNWLDIAAEWERQPERVILYNSWVADESYRRHCCATLGGTYSEATLDHIEGAGGGSAFDGASSRPRYATIFRNRHKYLSRRFVHRFLRKPRSYLGRLLSRRITPQELRTDERWPYIADRPETRPLFTHPELQDKSLRIFGFFIDENGRRREA